MRFKTLAVILACLGVAGLAFSMSGRSQKPQEQPEFETIQIGTGGAPKWSPDGTRLAFMSGGWLCVANADGSGEIERIAELRPWTFDWMSDSAFVISEKTPWTPSGKGRGHKFAIKTIDMNGQVQTIRQDSIVVGRKSDYLSYASTPFVLTDGTVGYHEVHERLGAESKIFKTIRRGTLAPEDAGKQMQAYVEPYPWGEIWLERVDGTERKKLRSGARKYTLPQLSPDGRKILAYYGGYYGGGLDVLDTNGNVIANIPAREAAPNLYANPTYETWSRDGEQIAYCLWAERGDTTYGSEIWVANSDGTRQIQVTNTSDEIETTPVFSPDGSNIAYLTQSGQVFVVKLK